MDYDDDSDLIPKEYWKEYYNMRTAPNKAVEPVQ